jgi:hypothetical protein
VSIDTVLALRMKRRLYEDVGAIFANTRRDLSGVCRMCTGPAEESLCGKCRKWQRMFGDSLADLVVPLAYAKSNMRPPHQSQHHMRQYKATPPAAKCANDLRLMMVAAVWLHRTCIGDWHVVTFVPSATKPDARHPLVPIARRVHQVHPDALKLRLHIGSGFDAEPDHEPQEDRFLVASEDRPTVIGKHVLIIEDTWVVGGKSQSAAIALKQAGAARVTILCVARWLRDDWSDHRELIHRAAGSYDAWRCPVSGLPELF